MILTLPGAHAKALLGLIRLPLDLAEHERDAGLKTVAGNAVPIDRLHDDDPVGVVMLGVDLGLEGVEHPQVTGVVSERQLLARQEPEVPECPASPCRHASTSCPVPERVLQVLLLHQPVDERARLFALLVGTVAVPQRVDRRVDGITSQLFHRLVVERAQVADVHQPPSNGSCGHNRHTHHILCQFSPHPISETGWVDKANYTIFMV